ncbi:MAG TPA: glycosyltransferase family 4 protein [Methanofastidiosum sp.]|nr:glycosyltransferase family 4 protein [Methanofastidiosum sp.]
MNILLIGAQITPFESEIFVGGVANNVARISKGFKVSKNICPTIITSKFPIQKFENKIIPVSWGNISIINVKGKYSSFRYGTDFMVKSLIEATKLNSIYNFDIVNGHSGYAPMGLVTIACSKKLNLPSVHTLYCPSTSQNISSFGKNIFTSPFFMKCYLNKLDKIIAVSNNVKTSLLNIGIKNEKISIVPLCVDENLFNQTIKGDKIRQDLISSSDDFLILFVGNLTWIKGIDILIDAMSTIVPKYPNFKLIVMLGFAYDGIMKGRLLSKIKILNLGNNVKLYSNINNINEYMAASDVVVLPFINTDGPSDYPLVLLEAMALGKTVIASSIGGIPEVIRHLENGILVSPGNVFELSNYLIKIYNDSNLKNKLGNAAAKDIFNKYSINRVTKLTEYIYEEIVKK